MQKDQEKITGGFFNGFVPPLAAGVSMIPLAVIFGVTAPVAAALVCGVGALSVGIVNAASKTAEKSHERAAGLALFGFLSHSVLTASAIAVPLALFNQMSGFAFTLFCAAGAASGAGMAGVCSAYKSMLAPVYDKEKRRKPAQLEKRNITADDDIIVYLEPGVLMSQKQNVRKFAVGTLVGVGLGSALLCGVAVHVERVPADAPRGTSQQETQRVGLRQSFHDVHRDVARMDTSAPVLRIPARSRLALG